MSDPTFLVNGQIVTASQFKAAAQKPAPRKAATPDSYHKGFRVEGHKPGAMEAARELRGRELARWAGMSEAAKKDARTSGEREPKPWDEAEWRRNTRQKAVRSKPYEIPSAADACAEMASAAGWLDVCIVEVKRGEIKE